MNESNPDVLISVINIFFHLKKVCLKLNHFIKILRFIMKASLMNITIRT